MIVIWLYGLNQSKNGQSTVKRNTHLITLQMNEINYKANMLQMKALNLTYSTVIIVKSERKQEWARSRTDKAELRRRSQEIKNPTDNALQFPLYTRTTNQTRSWMGCEGHQVETVQQLQTLACERWGQVWHPALQSFLLDTKAQAEAAVFNVW